MCLQQHHIDLSEICLYIFSYPRKNSKFFYMTSWYVYDILLHFVNLLVSRKVKLISMFFLGFLMSYMPPFFQKHNFSVFRKSDIKRKSNVVGCFAFLVVALDILYLFSNPIAAMTGQHTSGLFSKYSLVLLVCIETSVA